jgi:hypothetical protein
MLLLFDANARAHDHGRLQYTLPLLSINEERLVGKVRRRRHGIVYYYSTEKNFLLFAYSLFANYFLTAFF